MKRLGSVLGLEVSIVMPRLAFSMWTLRSVFFGRIWPLSGWTRWMEVDKGSTLEDELAEEGEARPLSLRELITSFVFRSLLRRHLADDSSVTRKTYR